MLLRVHVYYKYHFVLKEDNNGIQGHNIASKENMCTPFIINLEKRVTTFRDYKSLIINR